MKNNHRYLCFVLLLFTMTSLFGQVTISDPKRSAEEQAVFEKSVPLNPAKIPASLLADPKQDLSGINIVPVVWKPAVTPVDDRRDAGLTSGVPAPASGAPFPDPNLNNVQPQAPVPVSTGYHHDMKGSKTQPEAPEATTNHYRRIQGTNTQPLAEKPKR